LLEYKLENITMTVTNICEILGPQQNSFAITGNSKLGKMQTIHSNKNEDY